jgi:hypothetical protein
VQLVRGTDGDLYLVNSEAGVARLDEPNSTVIPPGLVRYTGADVYIGMQGTGAGCFGRPILDVAFDVQGNAYVVPVVVERQGEEPFVAAAKLMPAPMMNPPYYMVHLYDERPAANDNQRRDHLREIEVDWAGNVYVTNAHRLNESCMLWKYAADGTLLRSLSLLAPESPARVEDPVALHVSRDGQTVYLASGQYDPQTPGSATIYGLSTSDFSLARTIHIEGMPLVTSIAEDDVTGVLWVSGYMTEKMQPNPFIPAAFIRTPLLARVSSDVDVADAVAAGPADHDGSAVPTSLVWLDN